MDGEEREAPCTCSYVRSAVCRFNVVAREDRVGEGAWFGIYIPDPKPKSW